MSRSGVRRYTDELLRAAAPTVPLSAATVATKTAGAAADGFSLIEITWNGATIAAPYLDGVALDVGQVVLVGFVNSQPVILGRIIGIPPDQE